MLERHFAGRSMRERWRVCFFHCATNCGKLPSASAKRNSAPSHCAVFCFSAGMRASSARASANFFSAISASIHCDSACSRLQWPIRRLALSLAAFQLHAALKKLARLALGNPLAPLNRAQHLAGS
jgi:hypothetical protein